MVILGAGIVGSRAVRLSSDLGAEVVVVDCDLDRLRRLESMRLRGVRTLAATSVGVQEIVPRAHLLIGAVHIVAPRAHTSWTARLSG